MTTLPLIKFTPDFPSGPNGSGRLQLDGKSTAASSSHKGSKGAKGSHALVSRESVAASVGPPVITFGTTSTYTLMYNDAGSGADLDGAFYRPTAPSGFFILGDYAQGNHHPPSMSSITISVQNDDPTNPVLAEPLGYSLIWNDQASGADTDGSIWAPQPPPGYVALGAVSNTGYSPPWRSQVMCIRFDLVQAATMGQLIWNDQGSGANMEVEIYSLGGLTTFYAQSNYHPPLGPVWIPKALLS